MARGVNKVTLVGNLGNDPETKYMPSGGAVTNISIATSSAWKDKQTGQMNEKTEWHRVVFFNRLAEIAGEYLRKGSQVYVEGRLRYGSYEKDGVKHYTTEIVGNEMQMLGGKGGAGGGSMGGGRPPENDFGGNNQNQNQQSAPSGPAPDFDSFDDDIPF